MAVYGRNPLFLPQQREQNPKGGPPIMAERIQNLHATRAQLEQYLRRASEQQARYYNKNRILMIFKLGDKVLLLTEYIKIKDKAKKLSLKFIRLFLV